MVFGLLPNTQLDTFIDNLREQDVADSDISILTTSPQIANTFVKLHGSLHNLQQSQWLTHLQGIGLSESQATQLIQGVSQNTTLVAVDLPAQEWITESFHDAQAEQVWSSP